MKAQNCVAECSTAFDSAVKLQVNFYYCTVHFDNINIPFTNKCTLLLNT